MSSKFVLGCALSAMGVTSASVFAGPEWVEMNDAGSTINTAQHTVGPSQLTSIAGHLGGLTALAFGSVDYEDMYLIQITDPSAFSMQVTNAGFDAQLFLFNVTLPGEGFGLLANNDFGGSQDPFIGNAATDATGAQVKLPGIYAIAISGYGRDPVSLNGLIFNFADREEISGADGPGGLNPLRMWTGEGETGDYNIELTGAAPIDTPTPGALAVFGLACVVRRNRHR
ncbi:MAG TPA: hypothetical protein VG711_08405 [Phycisphaerales bacterium]|nr:hypothetical protein [Phycisphaerales bacterium]